jgi:hypothetical protein
LSCSCIGHDDPVDHLSHLPLNEAVSLQLIQLCSTGGITMFGRFLPQRIDNSYGGHELAPWLFALVVFMKTSIGLGTIFNGHEAAITADGIPLDAFTPAGAQAFVSVLAIWGLAQVMIVGLVLSLRSQDSEVKLT